MNTSVVKKAISEDHISNNTVILISFYNTRSLSLKHIETALIYAGFDVVVVYFKTINYTNPQPASDTEISLLKKLIRDKNPIAIGISVMASFVMETILTVNEAIKKEFDIPVVWGGIYPTMFAEECMKSANFVIRSEGEEAFIELLEAIKGNSSDYGQIKNLVYRTKDNTVVQNELRDLLVDLDKFGVPKLSKGNEYIIDNDTIKNEDPGVDSFSYETSGSRGCPHACAYCCSSSWKRINSKKGKTVRFRAIDKIIEELVHAKSRMKKLKFIRFYDEIFPNDEAWVDEFAAKYKNEVDLPFEIWGHPLRVDANAIRKLCKVGLYKITVGIQSGSSYIRREIFNRPEKQEDIIRASKVLSDAKVPDVMYDLILRHPFETQETLWETLHLCLALVPPFELQPHGLNFLPGTPIVQKALDMNVVTPEQMDKYLRAPMKEQYDMYWKNENRDETINYIYKLICLSQLALYRKKVAKLADPTAPKDYAKVDRMYKRGMRIVRARHIYKKLIMFCKGATKKAFGK